MPVVDVVNLDGKKVGQVELADAIFGAKVNQHLLHEASRWYLRGLRSGTHKTKDKSEVSGAGRKLWKQKGTARVSARSVRLSGVMAARFTDQSRAITAMRCRRRCCWARCVRRYRQNLPSRG
jgi:ribosomal protein L4